MLYGLWLLQFHVPQPDNSEVYEEQSLEPVASRSSCGYQCSAFDVVLDVITTSFAD